MWEAWLAVLVVKKAPNVCSDDGGPVAELADTYRRCAPCLAHRSTSCYTVFHWVEFKKGISSAQWKQRVRMERVQYCGVVNMVVLAVRVTFNLYQPRTLRMALPTKLNDQRWPRRTR